MSESKLESPAPAPSLFAELWALGKLLFGIALIAFGCWRAFVWAFGPDESLFFASRVSAKHAIEEAESLKKYAKGVRELKLSKRTPEEQAQELEKLERELATAMEKQAERVQKGYRMERSMELLLVLISFTFGPGLVWGGKDGVRWPRLRWVKPA